METSSLLPGVEIGTGLELGWWSWWWGGAVRRETEAQLPVASRPQEEAHAEEDLQQITVQVEPACSVEIVVPKEEDAG